MTGAPASWLSMCPAARRAPGLLVCLPYAGAGASAFRGWGAHLPSMDVWPLQPPGRESRIGEAPFVACRPLVRSLADALAPRLSPPYALFGHSMGALVAFELARELRRRHVAGPAMLLVSGHRAPQLPPRLPLLHLLPDAALAREVQRLGGTDPAVLEHPELRTLVLPAIRADLAVCETYVHEADAPLDCPIRAFGGAADVRVTVPELAAWREQTTATFRLRLFPGDHFYLHTGRALLLATLQEEAGPLLTAGRAVSGGSGLSPGTTSRAP